MNVIRPKAPSLHQSKVINWNKSRSKNIIKNQKEIEICHAQSFVEGVSIQKVIRLFWEQKSKRLKEQADSQYMDYTHFYRIMTFVKFYS